MMIKVILFFIFSFGLYATTVPTRDTQGNTIARAAAFASKSSYNFHGQGKVFTVSGSATTILEYEVDYATVKFNGIEIMGGALGDTVNLKIIDTPTGTYSTIPNYKLNQFGYNWNIRPELKEILPYGSDLLIGMRICVEYTNTNPNSKPIYINYYIHKE